MGKLRYFVSLIVFACILIFCGLNIKEKTIHIRSVGLSFGVLGIMFAVNAYFDLDTN